MKVCRKDLGPGAAGPALPADQVGRRRQIRGSAEVCRKALDHRSQATGKIGQVEVLSGDLLIVIEEGSVGVVQPIAEPSRLVAVEPFEPEGCELCCHGIGANGQRTAVGR